MFVVPDKSVICDKFVPDKYLDNKKLYRLIDEIKNPSENIYSLSDFISLSHEDYFITDTHIKKHHF